jgi:hypothetical protein
MLLQDAPDEYEEDLQSREIDHLNGINFVKRYYLYSKLFFISSYIIFFELLILNFTFKIIFNISMLQVREIMSLWI